jgi:hypothetical protein
MRRASGSVVVMALCCKLEGHGFQTRRGERILSIYLILPDPGVYSACIRNEYLKKKNNVSGEQSGAGA